MAAGTGAHHKAVNWIPQEKLANCTRVNYSLEGVVGKDARPGWVWSAGLAAESQEHTQ